ESGRRAERAPAEAGRAHRADPGGRFLLLRPRLAQPGGPHVLSVRLLQATRRVEGGQITTFRQLVPALFVAALVVTGALAPWSGPARLALAGIAGAYLTAAVAGAALALRKHGPGCAAALLVVFPVLHVSYGLGSIVAVLERLLGRRRPP